MADRRPTSGSESHSAESAEWAEGPATVGRRAPFSENPNVGARGLRTQQRILDAALEVFAESGYHQCSVGRITDAAGCSRVSFYQYFSDKEDLFRVLAGQVARQLYASTEALGMLEADAAGRAALRGWVDRHADVFDRYEPMFRAFRDAAESDEELAGSSFRVARRNLEQFCSRVGDTDLPTRQLQPMVGLLLESVTQFHVTAALLRAHAPEEFGADRLRDSLTDVMHRSLFGRIDGVNVHPPAGPTPGAIVADGATGTMLVDDNASRELTPAGRRTLEHLMESGRTVFLRRGYHRTRVDDIAAEAGLSHGAFYRYFSSKADLAQRIAADAMRDVSGEFEQIAGLGAADADGGGGPPTAAAISAWLSRYSAVQSSRIAAIRLWVDAGDGAQEHSLESAAVLDAGRRQLAAFLAPRGFGDAEMEALVGVAFISSFGFRERPPEALDAATRIVERGFLGN